MLICMIYVVIKLVCWYLLLFGISLNITNVPHESGEKSEKLKNIDAFLRKLFFKIKFNKCFQFMVPLRSIWYFTILFQLIIQAINALHNKIYLYFILDSACIEGVFLKFIPVGGKNLSLITVFFFFFMNHMLTHVNYKPPELS